jgi:hypothetical protein
MKKLVVLLTLALSVGAVAQQSSEKPSATRSRAHVAAPLAQPPATSDNSALPVGTAIRMRLETRLSSSTNQRGDSFGGRVVEAVMLNGKTIIPVGSGLEGDVIRAESPRRIKGVPTLDLMPKVVTLPDGQKYAINASLVDTNAPGVTVNDEGQVKGEGHDRADLVETGVGTAVGLGIGAKVGGFKGAMIGGGIGAGATVVHWLTKSKSTDLVPGTEIIIELNRPMQISAMQEGD